MRIVTVLGGSAALIPLVLGVGGWYWRRHGTPRPLALLSSAYGGSHLLSESLKALVARSRPPVGLAAGHFPGASFPSGHATQSAAAYGMLAIVLAAGTTQWRRRVTAWTGAVSVITVVGITRLYLGAHWLTDVLGGWVLGSLWLLLVVAASQAVAGRRATA